MGLLWYSAFLAVFVGDFGCGCDWFRLAGGVWCGGGR